MSRNLQIQSRELRRYISPRGQQLTMSNISGQWRPSGSVNACGMFAVVWSTIDLDFWAPLHDFSAVDQLLLIEACRRIDQQAGHSLSQPMGHDISTVSGFVRFRGNTP